MVLNEFGLVLLGAWLLILFGVGTAIVLAMDDNDGSTKSSFKYYGTIVYLVLLVNTVFYLGATYG